jgi:hypothetical protein
VKALGYEGNTTVRQAGGLRDRTEYRALVRIEALHVAMGNRRREFRTPGEVRATIHEYVSLTEAEKLASESAGGDLNYFFDQWLNGTGVPEFTPTRTSFRSSGYIVQAPSSRT